jgi:hypothetical protein
VLGPRIERRVNKLEFNKLNEAEKEAVNASKEAMRRQAEGKPDHPFRF